MEPIYTDIHIHTSDDPNNVNEDYDIDMLIDKVKGKAQGAPFLISLTDHNTINKNIYLKVVHKEETIKELHIILGAELHIKSYADTDAYHCHIFFKNDIDADTINKINTILDELYPEKRVEKKDPYIPTLETIIRKFDDYDFMLLPHGGQTHATFDTSIPRNVKFDTRMERSVYYNQFDGFTARAEKGRGQTEQYFEKLGIDEFINLITCSDNYSPSKYPCPHSDEASVFMPTWMFAEPTFDGLRLSLSEKTRLVFSEQKPQSWSQFIKSVSLTNDKIDIDIKLTAGLNVIIGGSSSGKTLLVDSMYKKLSNDSFETSVYKDFGVSDIAINNPSNMTPHFLSQNYVMTIVNNESGKGIEDIDIIKHVFPSDKEVRDNIQKGMIKLQEDISNLIDDVDHIENLSNQLRSIGQIASLIVKQKIKTNIFNNVIPDIDLRQNIIYTPTRYDSHIKTLNDIANILAKNPFAILSKDTIKPIIDELGRLQKISMIESNINDVIINARDSYDAQLKSTNLEDQTKNQTYIKLIDLIKQYVSLQVKFKTCLDEIANYSIHASSKTIESMGHKLTIINRFELTKEKVVEIFNYILKPDYYVNKFEDIQPTTLFKSHYKLRSPKVESYEQFKYKVFEKFQEINKTEYNIVTREGKEFKNLSPGWKTSVVLDLILGYSADTAPIMIDQPEDNLAPNYINKGLVDAIKQTKTNKQIIIVSHNATIPMMADAQNIIFCRENDGKLLLTSAPLEGYFDEKPVLDVIASVTDGGKSSIKKRVKKYNLKKFN